MSSTRTDLADGIHDVFRAEQPALYAAIVALLEAGADPKHLTAFIDRECRRARGHGPGLTENAAAVTIEVLARRRQEPGPTATCPECDGAGYHTDGMAQEDCRACDGTGRATPAALAEWERRLDAAEPR